MRIGPPESHREPWSKDTIDMRVNWVRSVMGFLSHEDRGESRVPVEKLTLALLIEPKIIDAYICFSNRPFGVKHLQTVYPPR
jgi:hypothetical protein